MLIHFKLKSAASLFLLFLLSACGAQDASLTSSTLSGLSSNANPNAPVVKVSKPAEGEVLPFSSIQVALSATGVESLVDAAALIDGVERIRTQLPSFPGAPVEVGMSLGVNSCGGRPAIEVGEHVLEIVVRDSKGNETRKVVSFSIR